MPTTAIVRLPGTNFGDGITTAGLGPPDFRRALAQHEAYCRALEDCGLEVVTLDADPRHPDGCFVEDTAVVTESVAVSTRPGSPARAGEEEAVAEVLAGYRALERIRPPGCVDGGDVLRVGSHFLIGRSARTNQPGADQLGEILAAHGYPSSQVPVEAGLHLKTGVTTLGDGRVVATAAFAPLFPRAQVVPVDPGEEYAANCLAVNGRLLVPAGHPGVRRRLGQAGYDVVEVAMSEFRKMDGGLTCLSLLL